MRSVTSQCALWGMLLAVHTACTVAVEDDFWYLQIGRNIKESAKAAGVIEQHLDVVWDKIKDFGNWNFVPGMTTVCAELDEATGQCLIRNVTQKGIEYGGYKFGDQFYQERQILSKRKDSFYNIVKEIHYERVSDSPQHSKKFQAKMVFKVFPDPTDPLYTFVEQSGHFKKAQRNIEPLAKEMAEVGFLTVINSLRGTFDDSKFAGHAVITLSHLFQHKIPIGGQLQVISGDYIFEKDIKHGIETSVNAGFDQIQNGWVTIKILSAESGNSKYDGGRGGRTVLCETSGQVGILPKTIHFNNCNNLHVTGRAVLPSLAAYEIFKIQMQAINLFELMEMADAGGKELIGFGVSSVNEQVASFIANELTPLDSIPWQLDIGNFTNIPSHVEQVAYEYFGLTVEHLMALLKGHIDWFINNLNPAMMQYKALTEEPEDPWLNFLIPESSRLEEAYQLAKIWGYDDEFCRQYLQGANPLEITKVKKDEDTSIIPSQFNNMYNIHTDELYYVEYSSLLPKILDYIPEGNLLYPDTFVLFRTVGKDIAPTSQLEVVGIQLEKHGIIYHKNDGYKWRYLFAKMWAQNAAMQTQEFLWHLGIAHFLPEALIQPLHNAFATPLETCTNEYDATSCAANVAVNEKLQKHPIYRLLKPHLKYTLGMGSLARLILDGRSTKVADVVFASGHKGVMQLIDVWYENYTFTEFTMESQILNRGINSDDFKDNYYYRDDALSLWKILKDYCKDIVFATYNNDNEIKTDQQLQLFAKLASENVNGFPNKFETRNQLSFSLANIIATPVILHTATNYAQAPYNYFPVNRPFRLKKKMSDWTESSSDLTPEFINEALPNFIEQFIGLMFMHVLTLPTDNSILDTASDVNLFADVTSIAGGGDNANLQNKLQQGQRKFYNKLTEFGEKIVKRNNESKKRGQIPYPYFHPSVTCSSTNI